jgi:hypothetical protein
MNTVIRIPITPSYPRDLSGINGECMSAGIQSLIGIEPECRFGEDYLEVIFTNKDFNQIKTWYGRKWRSNVTHEIKRHCRFDCLTPRLKELSITEQ